MTREEILKDLTKRFDKEIVDVFDKSPKRVYIEIDSKALVPIAKYLFKDLEARFNIASGLDARFHTEILYHFTIEKINLLISLRVKLDKKNPKIDSLATSFKAADWIEREMAEMLGIQFKGHPNLKRLLLPSDWPEGVYPLRRDYKEWDETAIRDRGE